MVAKSVMLREIQPPKAAGCPLWEMRGARRACTMGNRAYTKLCPPANVELPSHGVRGRSVREEWDIHSSRCEPFVHESRAKSRPRDVTASVAMDPHVRLVVRIIE